MLLADGHVLKMVAATQRHRVRGVGAHACSGIARVRACMTRLEGRHGPLRIRPARAETMRNVRAELQACEMRTCRLCARSPPVWPPVWGRGCARGMLVSEVCRSATCRVALPRVGLSAGREVARRRAPSCGVPVGAVCVCVRVQDADMLYVVRCGVLYVVCACPVPRTRARLG